MTLLRCVCSANADGIGLTALARESGMSKATVHRMMLALVAEGMVEQDAHSRHYYLGLECHILGVAASLRHGLHTMAAPLVSRLARECGDTAFLTVPRDVFAICVLREDGDYPLKTHALMPGDRHPIGVGAGSLAILAAMHDTEVEACLQANAALIASRYANYSLPSLQAQIQQTRQRGYALNEGLVIPGSWGMGIAITNAQKQVLGALSIAAPESRMQADRQPMLLALLQQAAHQLLNKWTSSSFDTAARDVRPTPLGTHPKKRLPSATTPKADIPSLPRSTT